MPTIPDMDLGTCSSEKAALLSSLPWSSEAALRESDYFDHRITIRTQNVICSNLISVAVTWSAVVESTSSIVSAMSSLVCVRWQDIMDTSRTFSANADDCHRCFGSLF